MRNWIKDLRPASFRGVPFFMEKEGIKFGRAIAVHTFVKSEEHATEDMGRLPREFRLTAYVASDRADAQARSLIEACSTEGRATLVLPFYGPVQARCTGGNENHEKTKLGYAAFDLEFVEAGEDNAGFTSLALGDRIAAGLMDEMPGMVMSAISTLPIPGLSGGSGIAADLPGLSIEVALPVPFVPSAG